MHSLHDMEAKADAQAKREVEDGLQGLDEIGKLSSSTHPPINLSINTIHDVVMLMQTSSNWQTSMHHSSRTELSKMLCKQSLMHSSRMCSSQSAVPNSQLTKCEKGKPSSQNAAGCYWRQSHCALVKKEVECMDTALRFLWR